MNLSMIKQIVKVEMGDRRSNPYNERGDKYTHGERVASLALRLRRYVFPNDHTYDDILTVAAWFHDILNGFHDREMHATLGAERTRELLIGHCTKEELEQICGIIAVHDDRKPQGKFYSNAVRIHQDADHLDHFGTNDIWRLALYTARRNETVNDALHYLEDHWPEDNERWRGELHFDLSRKIFDDKTEFVKSFLERFAVECVGGILNEKDIIASVDENK